MTKFRNRYVGMDVQKESIDIGLADADVRQEVRHFGCIGGDFRALDHAATKRQAPGKTSHLVYEAVPCDCVIYRHLAGKGMDCPVAASSMA